MEAMGRGSGFAEDEVSFKWWWGFEVENSQSNSECGTRTEERPESWTCMRISNLTQRIKTQGNTPVLFLSRQKEEWKEKKKQAAEYLRFEEEQQPRKKAIM